MIESMLGGWAFAIFCLSVVIGLVFGFSLLAILIAEAWRARRATPRESPVQDKRVP
jgi:hypothetical protein